MTKKKDFDQEKGLLYLILFVIIVLGVILLRVQEQKFQDLKTTVYSLEQEKIITYHCKAHDGFTEKWIRGENKGPYALTSAEKIQYVQEVNATTPSGEWYQTGDVMNIINSDYCTVWSGDDPADWTDIVLDSNGMIISAR